MKEGILKKTFKVQELKVKVKGVLVDHELLPEDKRAFAKFEDHLNACFISDRLAKRQSLYGAVDDDELS